MRLKIFLIGLLFILLLSSCSSNQPPIIKDPVKGGEIKLGVSGYNIDPIFTTNSELPTNNLTPILYRGLLKYNDKLQFTSDLAESFTIDKENNQIEFILKNNIKWEDGTPITVDDVKYTYEMYSNRSYNGYWKSSTLNIIGTDLYRTDKNDYVMGVVISPDARSIIIQYELLSANDLEFLTAPILSKQQLIAYSSIAQIKELSFQGKLLSNGPYKIEKLDDSEVKLVRNNSFEEDVYLDSIIISKSTDKTIYDIMLAVPSDIKNDDVILRNVLEIEGQGYEYLGMNLNADEFKDISIRKALASVINYQELITSIFQGYADKPLSPIHPKSWAYIADESNYGIEEAKAILENKGLNFQLAYEDTLKYQMLAEQISNKLAEYGITIELKAIQSSQYIPALFSKGEFDLFLASWTYEIDPVTENKKWLSKNDVLLNGFNVSHVNDQTSDSLLMDGATTILEVERVGFYKDWQNYFMDQYYIIPIASPKTIFTYKPELHVNITNSLVPYADIQNWWKEKIEE